MINLLPFLLSAQLTVAASYGVQIPGRQDLKFRFYENNVLQQNIETTSVRVDISAIENINMSYWWKKYGIRLDYFAWEHSSEARKFLTDDRPPFIIVDQSREALFLSFLIKSRLPFKWPQKMQDDNYYSFIGIGFGETLTEIDQGRTQWRAAFQISYGLSIPIIKKLKALIEFKLLITRDIDTLSGEDGWFVDTSGKWSPFRLGPHWDTKYYTAQFGLRWDLLN